jgi:hypothetical protein
MLSRDSAFWRWGEDDTRGEPFPFALNFDAPLPHEIGHLILFGTLGLPQRSTPTQDVPSLPRGRADFISLLGLLQFDSALDRILRRTRGNLLLFNDSTGALSSSDEKQVRSLSHSLIAP